MVTDTDNLHLENWIQNRWGFSENPFSIKSLKTKEELENLFEDREMEVKEIINPLNGSFGGKVFGISGRRGSGKSTVLNKVLNRLSTTGNIIIKIMASGYYEEFEFLKKFLSNICKELKGQKNLDLSSTIKESIIRIETNLFYTEKIGLSTSTETSLRKRIKTSFMSFFGMEVDKETQKKIEENIERTVKEYSISTIIDETLSLLKQLKEEVEDKKIIIGIDETDKCKFEEANKLLNHIKTILDSRYCHFIFVGVKEFHENFGLSFEDGNEDQAIIGSIFENVIFINTFDNREILRSIIDKRLQYYSNDKSSVKNPFLDDTIEVILDVSRGFPKQLMRICSMIFTYLGDEGEPITPADTIEYLAKRANIGKLTSTEQKYLKAAIRTREIKPSSDDFKKILMELKIEHKIQGVYGYLDRLCLKGFLQKKSTDGIEYSLTKLAEYWGQSRDLN